MRAGDIWQPSLTVDYVVVAGGGGAAATEANGGGGGGGMRCTVTNTGGGGTLETALSLKIVQITHNFRCGWNWRSIAVAIQYFLLLLLLVAVGESPCNWYKLVVQAAAVVVVLVQF
jgi:hypothetical protein